MPAPKVLTERELNRALLARQMLLERASIPIPRALERMGFLQNQYAPSGYIGLWSRVAGFERSHLTRALERRTVVQGTLLRATIHLVSRRDYWPVMAAIDEPLRDWWFRASKRRDEWHRLRAIDKRARDLLAGRTVAARRDPRRARPRRIRLGRCRAVDAARAGPAVGHVGASPGRPLRRRGRLDRAFDRDRGRAGRELLVRRYLAAFGPPRARTSRASPDCPRRCWRR